MISGDFSPHKNHNLLLFLQMISSEKNQDRKVEGNKMKQMKFCGIIPYVGELKSCMIMPMRWES